ncbi:MULTISPECIES: hypothetical protein [unclassified Bartonella]|uniref:hypothetical protein n=1 Tax=unclassified Bartonella TaxID=2645622 RepID=UPI0015FDE2C6|nr:MULTISPECIES: hypothetical protein [unclassified Bartonella]UXN03407.1 hypothetical protein N6B01_13340 [Bartonella sp. HY406]UXN06366.1 hypothetical protein N6A79_14040 [Bartonella sp. HY761]
MTMNTNRGFARNFSAKNNGRFSTNPAQFIGIYLKRKFAEVALQNAAPQQRQVNELNMVCKWVRDPATGHMECFWQKTSSDMETRYV